MSRQAEIRRETKETKIFVKVDLDGTGNLSRRELDSSTICLIKSLVTV